jgi:hypothetical protein
MSREELLVIDMLMFSTKIEMATTTQLITLFHKEKRENSLLPTLIFQNLLFSDTNLDIRCQTQIPWSFGRHNLVILQTGLKLSSINSSAQEKLNGMSKVDLLCFCLMAMMDRVQNIHLLELKDTFNCVTKMRLFQKMVSTMISLISEERQTCLSLIVQPLQTISIF